jgi:hypothetical protein
MLGVTNVDPKLLIDCECLGVRAVESHISRKTSEMWGTRFRGLAKVLGRLSGDLGANSASWHP